MDHWTLVYREVKDEDEKEEQYFSNTLQDFYHAGFHVLSDLVSCIPKYLENFSAFSVALMRMILRSLLRLRRSFTMMSKTSDCRFLSWISSSTKWLTLDSNLIHMAIKNK